MITEDYVSFETAKLLKEKGFDEDIDLWYDENGDMFFRHKYDISSDWRVKAQQKVYLSPTLQMAMKWLRETHGLNAYVRAVWKWEEVVGYDWFIESLSYNSYSKTNTEEPFRVYEEACETAIKYCLENLI